MALTSCALRSALAEFLQGVERQRAHWYCIFDPLSLLSSMSQDEKLATKLMQILSLTFPSLSTLTSLCEGLMEEVLLQCRLCKRTKHTQQINLALDYDAWHTFKFEYNLNIEMTKCKIGSQSHLYLCDGSWDSSRHPKRKPDEIWKYAQQTTSYPMPQLRISSLAI